MPPERLQLPLPFHHTSSYDARDFLPAPSNEKALAWLDAEWPDRRLALWGPTGSGKSHLLHIWAERTGAKFEFGQTLRDLSRLPESGGLALDDADIICDEPLLLHLLNTARDRGLRVLLSGRSAPSRWPVGLPDLSSRLRSIVAVEIGQPDDDLLAALLMRLLADRQLTISQSVQGWLLRRMPRSPEALREVVARLDGASLALRSEITRSFAASVLADADFSVANAETISAPAFDPFRQYPPFL